MLVRTANRTARAVAAPVVCLDADNTLWDTDGVFAAAQLRLLANVALALGTNIRETDPLSYIREVDQELASRHHLGLRYPPRLLIAALCHRLLGLDPGAAARSAWSDPFNIPVAQYAVGEIESTYSTDLRVTPKLLPGVLLGLKKMHRAGAALVLVTEGGRRRVEDLLRANEIDEYIDRIVDSPKRKELFSRLKRLFGSSVPVYMIGDQITRDIIPAAEAGLQTIHVQGKFQPVWEIGVSAPATVEKSTFEDAADWVLSTL